jgi:hypothetical protein
MTFKLEVVGSSPTGRTNRLSHSVSRKNVLHTGELPATTSMRWSPGSRAASFSSQY